MKCVAQPLPVLLLPFALLVSCQTKPTTPALTRNTPAKTQPARPAAQQPAHKPYPLTTCLVSDQPLDAKGTPVVQIYQGQEVKFCCRICQTIFHLSPDHYLLKL